MATWDTASRLECLYDDPECFGAPAPASVRPNVGHLRTGRLELCLKASLETPFTPAAARAAALAEAIRVLADQRSAGHLQSHISRSGAYLHRGELART
jgi:hypothetical protein